jgi:hypothetical protein
MPAARRWSSLLAAAAEDERIAALEANHPLAIARGRHHQLLDEGLRCGLAAAAFADVDHARRVALASATMASLTRSSTSSTVACAMARALP